MFLKFLKAIGIGFLLRKAIPCLTPSIEIAEADGDMSVEDGVLVLLERAKKEGLASTKTVDRMEEENMLVFSYTVDGFPCCAKSQEGGVGVPQDRWQDGEHACLLLHCAYLVCTQKFKRVKSFVYLHSYF